MDCGLGVGEADCRAVSTARGSSPRGRGAARAALAIGRAGSFSPRPGAVEGELVGPVGS